MPTYNGLKGIFIYFSWEDTLASLSAEDFKILVLSLMKYARNRDADIAVPAHLSMAFGLMKGTINESIERQESVRTARSIAGKLGGRPKTRSEDLSSEKQRKQLLSENQMLTEKQKKQKSLLIKLDETRLDETRLDELEGGVGGEDAIQRPQKEDQNQKTKLDFPSEKIRESWNAICVSLSPLRGINGNRERILRARWKEHPDLEWWEDFFKKIAASRFLCGKVSDWKATFDWCIKAANMDKILEGRYDEKEVEKDGADYPDDDQRRWTEFPQQW